MSLSKTGNKRKRYTDRSCRACYNISDASEYYQVLQCSNQSLGIFWL